MISKKNIHYYVFYFAIFLLSIALPTYSKFINVAIVILIVNWIVEGHFKAKIRLLKERPLSGLFILFFMLHVVGMLYSSNTSIGWFNLEKKIALLIFPIVLCTSQSPPDRKMLGHILLAFVISCLGVSLVCLCFGIYMFKTGGTSEYLVYDGLTDIIGLQPIYFGMYLCFASSIVFWLLLNNQMTTMKRIILILVNLYFFCFVILLSARTAAVTFGLLNFFGGIIYAHRLKKAKWFFVLAVVMILVGALITSKIPTLKERIFSIASTKFYFNPKENNANGLTLRLVKWQCSLEGLRSNLLLGVGTGDMQDFLQNCYKEKEFWGQVYAFNSHNQFLQTALGLGTVGLIILVLSLFLPAIKSFNKKEYLYVVFVILVSICFLTESVLERKQGVVFYSFFNALFTLSLLTEKRSQTAGLTE